MARSAGSTSSTSKRPRKRRAQRGEAEGGIRGADAPGGASPHVGAALVCIGRVAGAHGLRGELRVRLAGAALESFDGAPELWLARDASGAGAVAHALRAAAPGRGGECRLALAGIEDRTAAEAARGRWLLARAEDLARAGPDEYYVYELVGCRVEDAAGRALGAVRALCGNGALDLLVVEDAGGRERLVPLARALLVAVDVAARRIVLDPPQGLFESGG